MARQIHLLAWSPADGSAVLEYDSKYSIVRPPYEISSRLPIQEADLAQVISGFGHTTEDVWFSDWARLISWLRTRVEEETPPERLERSRDAAKRLLLASDEHAARRHLERVERNLLSVGRWEEGGEFLELLLRAKSIQSNSTLLNRALDLQRRASTGLREELERRANRTQSVSRREEWLLPAVVSHGRDVVDNLRRKIAKRGQVLLLSNC